MKTKKKRVTRFFALNYVVQMRQLILKSRSFQEQLRLKYDWELFVGTDPYNCIFKSFV